MTVLLVTTNTWVVASRALHLAPFPHVEVRVKSSIIQINNKYTYNVQPLFIRFINLVIVFVFYSFNLLRYVCYQILKRFKYILDTKIRSIASNTTLRVCSCPLSVFTHGLCVLEVTSKALEQTLGSLVVHVAENLAGG